MRKAYRTHSKNFCGGLFIGRTWARNWGSLLRLATVARGMVDYDWPDLGPLPSPRGVAWGAMTDSLRMTSGGYGAGKSADVHY